MAHESRIAPPSSDKLKVPIPIEVASDSDAVAISFGASQPPKIEAEVEREPVQVEIVDVSTGKHVAEWAASDIPQSLSPKGRFVTVSDWSVESPLVNVEVVDAQTGQKVTTLNAGYAFRRNQHFQGAVGKVVGKFLSEDEVLLAPDEHWDFTGHYSGSSLKVVRISDGKTLREVTLENYGPTGELAISANGELLVTISSFLSPYALTHDVALPSGWSPEVRVSPLSRRNPEVIIKLSAPRVVEYLANHPRVSSDGSVIAVAQENGVTVFESKWF